MPEGAPAGRPRREDNDRAGAAAGQAGEEGCPRQGSNADGREAANGMRSGGERQMSLSHPVAVSKFAAQRSHLSARLFHRVPTLAIPSHAKRRLGLVQCCSKAVRRHARRHDR